MLIRFLIFNLIISFKFLNKLLLFGKTPKSNTIITNTLTDNPCDFFARIGCRISDGYIYLDPIGKKRGCSQKSF